MCAPTENKGMIFTSDKGKEYRFAQEGVNVWRCSFDSWLAEKASECGVEVRDCTNATACVDRGDYVTVTLFDQKKYTENARYVLDCEGVVGSLKRNLFRNSRDYIITFQTFYKGTIDLDPHFFYAYLQPELSEYDAWFNVKDNLLVLGVSVRDGRNIMPCYERFLSFMRSRHNLRIVEQLNSERWLMPHIRPGCKIDYGIGRIMLAGEIAGFLNPMGEGISAGMESGFCAASALSENFENLDMVYVAYKENTVPLKTYMERQWSFVGGIASPFEHMKL